MTSRPHKRTHAERLGQPRYALVLIALVLLLAATSQSQAKYSGGQGTRDDPYLIGTTSDLLTLAADPNDWTAHFKLAADLEMADVPRDTVCMIGTAAMPFKGSFDGAGRRILHFTSTCSGRNRVGLFGHIRALNGGVRNLCLVDPNVVGAGGTSVGALVGHLGTGSVVGCRVEGGHVSGSMAVGGLVGWSYATITECTAQARVHGRYSVGGLVGLCAWDAQVRRCAADACVTGISRVGGLAGACTSAIVEWSSARGSANGSMYIGGLSGCGEGATIANCYSTTSVIGDSIVGGLAGSNGAAYDDGNSLPGAIYNCYSTGAVTGRKDTGGLVAINEADCIVSGSFWDTQTSGITAGVSGTGLPTAQLQSPATFVRASWDFLQLSDKDDHWTIVSEAQYPIFAWQIPANDANAPAVPGQ